MGSRRLDISSLLCSNDPPNIVQDPVVLAPHLRNPAITPPQHSDPSSSSSSSSSIPTPRRRTYSDYYPPAQDDRSYPDQHRPLPPPRSIDNLIHPHTHPPTQSQSQSHSPSQSQSHSHSLSHQDSSQFPPPPPALPRPSSSSSSLSARSPAVAYSYPAVRSPSHSPLTQTSGLPPPPPQHPGHTSPAQQRSSSSPFYQPSQTSPLLHRPSSSHSQALPRHPSVSHRSRSNTTTSASPSAALYSLPSPQITPSPNKMAFASLEALVHAATEERKRLSATAASDHGPASPSVHHSLPRHPPNRSSEDPYRSSQSITSPSLPPQREYPAVLPPPSHVSRHRHPLPVDDPRPVAAPDFHSHSRPPPLPRHQYEDDQRQHILAQHQELQRLERQRTIERWEQRQREEALRQKRLQELQLQEEMERERLLEQQRLERLRLQEEQLLVERRMQERQQEQQRLEQQRLLAEEHLRLGFDRRRQDDERHRLELREHQRQDDEQQLELDRRHQEDEDLRRREEHRRIEEELRREEGERRRLQDEQRKQELERQRQEDELRHREENRRIEEEERRRWLDDQRRREEERREDERRLEERRLAQEAERERLQAEREEQERRSLQQRQQEIRLDDHYATQPDQRRSSLEDHPPPSAPQIVPAIIELPQPVRPYHYATAPHKFDPVHTKRQASSPEPPPLQISTSIPLSPPADDHRPTKKQRYSESPPLSSTEAVYPRVVALPPPISNDQLPHRPGSSGRRPGSGQGRRQAQTGLGDAVEREKEKEREREREKHPLDAHRIISPLGRRSPPGSQIGRAKAARKSDDARRADEAATAAAIADVRKTEEPQPQVKKADETPRSTLSPVRTETARAPQEQNPTASHRRDSSASKADESLVRKPAEDAPRKLSLSAVMNEEQHSYAMIKKESPHSATAESLLRPKDQPKTDPAIRLSRDDKGGVARSRSSDANRAVADAQKPPSKSREINNKETTPSPRPPPQEDAHEWLLDHYSRSPRPAQLPSEPPHSLSPSLSPTLPINKQSERHKARVPPSEADKAVTAPRSVSPDADAALERELAELMAEDDDVPVHKREPDDMDIDLAVAQTLEEDGQNASVATMEVDDADDVEDELLSLVDDRPPLPSVPPPPPAAGRRVTAPTIPSHQSQSLPKPSSLKTDMDGSRRQSSPALSTSAPSPSAVSPIVQLSSGPAGSDRGSIPPPAAGPRGKEKEEEVAKKDDTSNSATLTQPSKKKKDAGSKVASKSKAGNAAPGSSQATASSTKQQKPKAAATKKPSTKGVDAVTNNSALTSTTSSIGTAKPAKSSAMPNKKAAAVNHATVSRSRSTSVMPSGSVDPEQERKSEEKNEEEEENAEAVDDKLYCVCKTKYDEDRFMIACDRCDEWYHTTCVNMPDLEVDLVDQFFCPLCIEQNPHLRLKTTYKQRCLNGLRHPDPDSPKACHKPARGAFSKYCSDECGVKYMQSRIDVWAKKGGKKEELWESVKNAERREGVAICVDEKIKSELEKKKKKKQGKGDRESERLQVLLNQVVKMREEIKGSMEVLVWRERLLQLASERAEHIDQCGWDQRLCFGDEEWQDFGAGVLESYDDVKTVKEEGGMQVDEGEEEGEWWCPGSKSCKRHSGWQTLRYKDICREREKKEDLLTKTTTRERQLRKRIEDLVDPSGRKSNDSTSQIPLKSSNTKLSNGHARSKGGGETLKKGKKRKAPAS